MTTRRGLFALAVGAVASPALAKLPEKAVEVSWGSDVFHFNFTDTRDVEFAEPEMYGWCAKADYLGRP